MSETQKKKTLGLARASLICGCFFIVPLLGSILGFVAIILGVIALVKISKNAESLGGIGFAIAGIVLGIVGNIVIPSLAFFLVPLVFHSGDQVPIAVRMVIIEHALVRYETANGKYPSSAEGLNALLEKPASAPKWNGPYLLKRQLVDPWGRAYQYKYPSDRNEEYDLYSLGENEIENSDDIYSE